MYSEFGVKKRKMDWWISNVNFNVFFILFFSHKNYNKPSVVDVIIASLGDSEKD